jgi:hypothetical protein
MKVTDITNKADNKPITNEAVPLLPVVGAVGRAAAPYIAKAGANVMKALRGGSKPQTPVAPSTARQTYSPTTGQTAVPKQSQSMATSFDDPKYWQPPVTKGERAANLAGLTAAGLGTGVAAGFLASSPKGREPTPPAGSSTPTPPAGTSTPPAPAARPAPARAPQSQPARPTVGAQLAALSGGEFATRADRTNQAKVNAILGSGYKAGTAAANLALRDYYKANPPMSDAQRQELGQEIFNQNMARHREQGDGVATVRPTGSSSSNSSLTKPTEPLSRVEIPASGGSSSGGPSSASPAASSSGDSSDNTVKSGTGLTWTDSSGQPIVTMPEEKNSLMRLLKLSGQKH